MSKFALLVLLFVSNQVFASGSFGVRGGGSVCVETFIAYGKILHANAQKIDYNAEAFLEKVKTAEIVEVETEMVMYEGNQYIAMNEPASNRIYLSQKWCRDAREALQDNRVAQIAFHEFLGLSEPGRDKNYELSADLYDKTGLTEEDFHYLVITNGRERHLFKTEVYTWARGNQAAYPFRAYLQLAPSNFQSSAVFDCAMNGVKKDGAEYREATLLIMGHKAKYSFFNTMMCDNLLEFLMFRQYSKIKISFLVGTTSMTVYDVIME
jgi:hypothetical protein